MCTRTAGHCLVFISQGAAVSQILNSEYNVFLLSECVVFCFLFVSSVYSRMWYQANSTGQMPSIF